jgi:O-acetylhomoserine (thiol)-lyase
MKLETLVVHAGYSPDPTTKAVAVPIYQTTSYAFDDTQHGADLFDLKVAGNIYTRIMNPTTDVLEKRVAALEGGVGALGLASGQAAITYALLTITEAGQNIISSSALYGGTYNLFAHTLPQYGISVRFADHRQPQAFEKLIDTNTRAIFCESVGNPAGNVTDFAALAEIAHRHGIPLIVDNTVPSPYLCRPIDWGADIVLHSATKYLGGHGTTMGGVVVESGRFPWDNGNFPGMTEPSKGYHGVRFYETFGDFGYTMRLRMETMRTFGPALSPLNAWLLLQGVESLHVRMERHCANALAVAQHLQAHPQVAWVNYPGLPDNKYHALAQKYLPKGASGLLNFGVRGGAEAGRKFIEAAQFMSHLVNIGDAKTLISHPASTTHRQMGEEEQRKAGVTPDMVRMSVGIESIDDLLWDIDQALHAATH